jgi:hypothetical protein
VIGQKGMMRIGNDRSLIEVDEIHHSNQVIANDTACKMTANDEAVEVVANDDFQVFFFCLISSHRGNDPTTAIQLEQDIYVHKCSGALLERTTYRQ